MRTPVVVTICACSRRDLILLLSTAHGSSVRVASQQLSVEGLAVESCFPSCLTSCVSWKRAYYYPSVYIFLVTAETLMVGANGVQVLCGPATSITALPSGGNAAGFKLQTHSALFLPSSF